MSVFVSVCVCCVAWWCLCVIWMFCVLCGVCACVEERRGTEGRRVLVGGMMDGVAGGMMGGVNENLTWTEKGEKLS